MYEYTQRLKELECLINNHFQRSSNFVESSAKVTWEKISMLFATPSKQPVTEEDEIDESEIECHWDSNPGSGITIDDIFHEINANRDAQHLAKFTAVFDCISDLRDKKGGQFGEKVGHKYYYSPAESSEVFEFFQK